MYTNAYITPHHIIGSVQQNFQSHGHLQGATGMRQTLYIRLLYVFFAIHCEILKARVYNVRVDCIRKNRE